MNLTTREINELKEENKLLKKRIQKLKRESIKKSEMEYLLSFLIPESEEQWDYEVFVDLNCPYLTLSELLKIITLALKLNRADLAVLICDTYISKNYIVDNADQQEFEQLLIGLIKESISHKDIEINHILLIVLTYRKKQSFNSIYINAYEKYIDLIFKLILAEDNDQWLRKVLFDLFDLNYDLFFRYVDYLSGHWPIVYHWITEETIDYWNLMANISRNERLIAKIEKRREDFHIAKNGIEINKITYRDDKDEAIHKLDGETLKKWKDESELKSFGYVVSNKSDEQRRAALNTAMRHMPISKIVSHIQWLLRNSYNKHERIGDFSQSMRAYESDLIYLKKYFNS